MKRSVYTDEVKCTFVASEVSEQDEKTVAQRENEGKLGKSSQS